VSSIFIHRSSGKSAGWLFVIVPADETPIKSGDGNESLISCKAFILEKIDSKDISNNRYFSAPFPSPFSLAVNLRLIMYQELVSGYWNMLEMLRTSVAGMTCARKPGLTI